MVTHQLGPAVDLLSKSLKHFELDSHGLVRTGDRTILDGGHVTPETPPQSNPINPTGTPTSPQSQSARHLLSLHEGLRSQVDGLVNQVSGLDASLATIDARQSMALMNETLRIKEDLAHLTAGMYTLRSQMGWLLNNRNAQLRGREGATAVPAMVGPAAVASQSTSSSSATAASSASHATLEARPQPRRSSSGNSSQERVKL